MKIAICAVDGQNGSLISESFRRADFFIVVDTDCAVESENRINNFNPFYGSEIFSAQFLISEGINLIVCGSCEEDAKKLFKEAKIKVVENAQGDVTAFSNNFLSNLLNIAGHN